MNGQFCGLMGGASDADSIIKKVMNGQFCGLMSGASDADSIIKKVSKGLGASTSVQAEGSDVEWSDYRE